MADTRPAIVVGATGATGRQVVAALLASDRWSEVVAVVRAPRPELFAEGTPKLRVQVVPDLVGGMASAAETWPAGSTLFNAIGTTRGAAGGAAGFKAVEVGITTAAVAAAAGAGVTHVSCVSAQGARNGWVDPWEMIHPLLYARTLWQKEQACISAGIPRVSIFQPGMLQVYRTRRVTVRAIIHLQNVKEAQRSTTIRLRFAE